MPLYDFECQKCGRRVEVHTAVRNRDIHRICRALYRISGPPCSGDMRRLVSAAVQLNPPTGAALRSHFRLYQEAVQDVDQAYTRAGVEPPPFAKLAQKRAHAIVAAGEAPTPRPFE